MKTAPQGIKAHQQQRILEIVWSPEHITNIPYRFLRGNCPCANCVNELTGVRKFFPEDAPEDIHPNKMELVGNYAMKIVWSDNHSAGIYTWDHINEIASHQP